jgi:hypothetical protein
VPEKKSSESVLLDQHPGVRQVVESLTEFIAWSTALPIVEIDGENFYVGRGDEFMDRDQTIVEWIRLYRPGLLERKMTNGTTK